VPLESSQEFDLEHARVAMQHQGGPAPGRMSVVTEELTGAWLAMRSFFV
jgi:hypothetical protein